MTNNDKRKLRLMLHTPSWSGPDEAWMMREAKQARIARERVTGIKWHLDHVVPLAGAYVSGLHLPWNLRLVPASTNGTKGSRHESDRGFGLMFSDWVNRAVEKVGAAANEKAAGGEGVAHTRAPQDGGASLHTHGLVFTDFSPPSIGGPHDNVIR